MMGLTHPLARFALRYRLVRKDGDLRKWHCFCFYNDNDDTEIFALQEDKFFLFFYSSLKQLKNWQEQITSVMKSNAPTRVTQNEKRRGLRFIITFLKPREGFKDSDGDEACLFHLLVVLILVVLKWRDKYRTDWAEIFAEDIPWPC